MRLAIVVAALSVMTGCMTAGAVGPMMRLDTNSANQCKSHCQSLGMQLGAVVIIANNTGCVCQPAGKTISDASGSSAVAGGAMIVMQSEQQRQSSSK